MKLAGVETHIDSELDTFGAEGDVETELPLEGTVAIGELSPPHVGLEPYEPLALWWAVLSSQFEEGTHEAPHDPDAKERSAEGNVLSPNWSG